MAKMKDLTGKRFGYLTAICVNSKRYGRYFWMCTCNCGKTTVVDGGKLTNGWTRSCGCFASKQTALRSKTHGMSKSAEYQSWQHMKNRCYKPNNKRFHRYGGRGITVCERWQNSFENFFADMGLRPTTKHTLERIDNNGSYDPKNCRWATNQEQSNNRCDNHNITIGNKTLPVTEWAKIVGIKRQTLSKRLKLGWTPFDAITKPVRRR